MPVRTQATQVSKTFPPLASPTIHSATVLQIPPTFHHRTQRRQRFTATAPLTFPLVVFMYVNLRFDTIAPPNPLGEVFLSQTFSPKRPLQSFTLRSTVKIQDSDPEIFLQHGNLKLFPAGQLNTPDKDTDLWQPQGQDSASQSACGIPDNAFSISKVAIHPYFLKYADLSRKLEHT